MPLGQEFLFQQIAAPATASFVLPSIVVYGINSRAATATGSFVPLRSTQDDRWLMDRSGNRKKGAALPLPFFPPHPHRQCHPERSEGSRGLTAVEKEPG